MNHLFTLVPHPSHKACAEFKISLRSFPFLADHAFQDMVVLPGSFYIEMALCLHQEVSKSGVPVVVRNVKFQNPVILSSEDAIIRIEVRSNGDTSTEYTFYEGTGENGRSNIPHQYAARLEIECGSSALQEAVDESFSIETFKAQAHDVIDSKRFYKQLRDNGNQYGASFQGVSSIWRIGNESLGRLSWKSSENHLYGLRSTLLDSMTHVLAPFMMAQGRTFVLRSIEHIDIRSLNFPDTLWCHATLRSEDGIESDRVGGDVRVFDASGKMYLQFSGVAFILLEHQRLPEEIKPTQLVLASNFTADPVEDSLTFWAAHFDLQTNIEFAPYDQVFQQLLHTESAFSRNTGVNVILLQLEKWADDERNVIPNFDKKTAEQHFGKRKRSVLPNGLEIVDLNQYETDYLYKEIFEDECYLKHGIRLPEEAVVVDIGANIGLFSLFVMSRCRNPRIYAFEPAPIVYDLLRANCEVYGSNAHALNLGVSDHQGTANFTFYENSSVFSSFHSDESQDRKAIQAVVRSILKAESGDDESVQEYVNDFTTDRLLRRTYKCRLTTVSNIIRENHIEKIDLLKIDAEKSELQIISGIADCDWPKIDQVVIEVHDHSGNAVREIKDLLIRKGYRCAIEQEKLLEDSGFFNLFATREESGARVSPNSRRIQNEVADQMPQFASSLQRNVDDFCAALQTFTRQMSAPLIVCLCPPSPAVEVNAKLKAALADAEREIVSRTSALPDVSTIASEPLLRRYPVTDYYDIHGHQLGDIPYTPECFAAIGTAVFRTIFNLKRKPFKVIALDCDNTLWKGVCGEDGPDGVEVTESHRALQRFMVAQMNAGMLLSLCSKNNEQDVMDVFDRRADMLLKREHLASWRINWNSKSENIKSIASELNLALDSFIFIDDNPVECADVDINCPGVLTLRLPQDLSSYAAFLEHIWAFDHSGTTEEDRSRVTMYQDNARREHFRAETPSLNDFIAGLILRIDVAEATEDQLGRISQLTFRTNQFNFTTIRRSPREVSEFLGQENAACLAVRVTDRFGDYGLVGVVLYQAQADRLQLDTFLLSCRVLGRGVEHRVLSSIGQRALNAGKKFVELSCIATERNLPARQFLSSLGHQYRTEGDSWLFPAEYLAGLQYNPDERAPQSNDNPASPEGQKPSPAPSSESAMTVRSEQLQSIGEELYDMGRLAKAINEFRLPLRDHDSGAAIGPSDNIEKKIVKIWSKVLGKPGIGPNVNFFEMGGTSLKAVQVVSMIRKELKRNLSLVGLFECPTVRLLAARLSEIGEKPSSEPRIANAALRGQQRRSRAMRRTKNQ